MKRFLLILLALPQLALAETVLLDSKPDSAVIYFDGAIVTREIEISLEAGAHTLIVPNLIDIWEDAIVDIAVEGAVLKSESLRSEDLPPRDLADSPRLAAAKAALEAAEQALRDNEDEIAEAGLERGALTTRAELVARLGGPETPPQDIAHLQALADFVADQTLETDRALLAIDRRLRALEDSRETLAEAVDEARHLVAATEPPSADRTELSLILDAPESGPVSIRLQYYADISWAPRYAIKLAADGGSVLVERNAVLSTESGEPLEDIRLTLSTAVLSEALGPTAIRPFLRRITDAEPSVSRLSGYGGLDRQEMLAEPVLLEEAYGVTTSGPAVTYEIAGRTSLSARDDFTSLSLGTLTLPAERFVRASPRYDETAFRMAEITNTTDEPLLAGQAFFYVENSIVGAAEIDEIPAGGTAELAFGPIEDLRLAFKDLSAIEGDTGLISRSNTLSERSRMEIVNLGDNSWEVVLRDRVPYSEQEDLEITWRATPSPRTENVDDLQGVLEWLIPLAPGARAEIESEVTLRWPPDKVME